MFIGLQPFSTVIKMPML